MAEKGSKMDYAMGSDEYLGGSFRGTKKRKGDDLELEENVGRLKRTNTKLLDVAKNLKDQLPATNSGKGNDAGQYDRIKILNDKLEQAKKLLENKDKELTSAKMNLETLTRNMDILKDRTKNGNITKVTLDKEKAKLVKEYELMNAEKDKTIQELNDTIKDLENQNIFLKSGLRELKSEMNNVVAENSAIKGEMKRVDTENEAVKGKMADMNEKMLNLELETGETRADLKQILTLLKQEKQ